MIGVVVRDAANYITRTRASDARAAERARERTRDARKEFLFFVAVRANWVFEPAREVTIRGRSGRAEN